MSNKYTKSVLIVGGGTAGWLTACSLAKALSCDESDSVTVTVVESPDIPTIGVGEGTWPTMRRTLETIGIDETEFIRNCSASFKQGTKFHNWANNQRDNSYYNLFSSIYDPGEFNLAPYWAMGFAGSKIAYADAVSAQGYACENHLAPKKITSQSYEALQSYAYHLDAGKFADLLKKHATENLGVTLIPANVIDVTIAEDGFVDSVLTKESGIIAADFFVDCSGFSSLILGQALGIPFKSVADVLHTDTALAMQVPYQDENEEVACVTHSTAQSAGWIWDIGLQNRRGVGHVYSSAFTSDDEAEQALRSYVGSAGDELEARKIKMQIGYREKFWHKNCVAIGLSAAFVEPLEASAIFLVEAAGNMISDLFPTDRNAMRHAEVKFNQSFQFRWSRTIDFIKLHYALSEREGDFWQHNRTPETIPDSLAERLDAWSYHPISKYDFTDINEPFPHESYQYILHGMGRGCEISSDSKVFRKIPQAQRYFDNVQRATKMICKDLPTHRSLLNKVNEFGFQKI